jgi:restriction endonuclease
MIPDWKHYEKQILELIKEEFPKAEISFDKRLLGIESKTLRQIDILISFTKSKKKILGIAECKNFTRKVSIGVIDSLLGKMIDLHADFGIIYSALGFTKGAEQFAKRTNIGFRQMPFEFLKDFGFIDSNSLDSEIFIQETEYRTCYCKKCNITNLYEIKIIRGFADYEDIICPQCKTPQLNSRTDGEYRVIKRFANKKVSENEINSSIVKHLLATRKLWDKKYSFEWSAYKNLPSKSLCFLCHKKLSNFPSSFAIEHGKHTVCNECSMSQRTLLIDYKKA